MTDFSDSNANIDPQLLALDPLNQMLAQMRNSSYTPPFGDSSDDMPLPDEDEEMQQPAHEFAGASGSSLVTFGNLVKRQVNLTDKSKMMFEQYCQNRSPDERNAILFAHVLELLDISRKNEKAEVWVIAPALSKKIAQYTQSFIYSPNLAAYRGLRMAEHVMLAMRESNVADLPPEEETSHCEMVLSRIRDKATHYRNILKSTILESLEKDDLRNIACLANKLLQQTKIKPTLQFYLRVAYIRTILVQYTHTEETFWITVDEKLLEHRKDCTTTAELDKFYNLIYQNDVKKYGDPATTPYKTAEFNATSSSWQAVVRKHSANVQTNPKNGHLLAEAAKAAASAFNPNKRPRTDDRGGGREDEQIYD